MTLILKSFQEKSPQLINCGLFYDIIDIEVCLERKISVSYKAIYRKFRPTTFDDVLGQEHITTILKNQIKNDNIAHAYLFSGTRGTGKTSTARIFARAINCEGEGVPCNTCDICRGIIEESVMDIIEIDAASNNSVEDIRELRENSKYPPSNCRYKVYIIDEVHMLSKGAFNALLKILEEPPVHLVFILATTEPQKLPATILSRCQRYDFKRVSVENIVKNMKKIIKEVGVEVENSALELIARNSDGAMRDGLSILDQCISFTEGVVTTDYVISVLGIVNNDLMFSVVDDIIKRDVESVLESLDEVIREGIDIKQFIKDLILHFRNIMVAKASQNVENSIDGTEEFIERIRIQSKDIELVQIINFLNLLSETENKAKWSTQPKIILEVDLINMMSKNNNVDFESLIDRIEKLETELKERPQIVQSQTMRDTKSVKTEKAEQPITPPKNREKKEAPLVETSDVSFDLIKQEWPNLLKRIKTKKIALHALITEGMPKSFKNGILTIAFKEGFGFHKDALDKEANREAIQSIIGTALAAHVELKLVMEDKIDEVDESADLLQDVIDVFGKDLVEVED